MRVLSSTTRPLVRRWPTDHPMAPIVAGAGTRPLPGGALALAPLPVLGPGGRPFAGMDPSDPVTFTRPWNPAPGMIGYLNFDGAQAQAQTDMGGVWGAPAAQHAQAGARPKRRPRLWRYAGSGSLTVSPP